MCVRITVYDCRIHDTAQNSSHNLSSFPPFISQMLLTGGEGTNLLGACEYCLMQFTEKWFVLLLFMQVAFRCFYTAVHNKHLFPTFSRASGRAGSRYAQLFNALANEFQWRKLVIFGDNHDQSAHEMTGYIRRAAVSLDVVIKYVRPSKSDPYRQHLRDIMDDNSETG